MTGDAFHEPQAGAAFYEPLGEGRYRSTEHTTGPWSPDAQHGGPPSALLGTCIEAALGSPVARFTAEILRPVPITDLTVEVEVIKRGRTTAVGQAVLLHGDTEVMRARATAVRREAMALPEGVAVEPDPTEVAGPSTAWTWATTAGNYAAAMDLRFTVGGWDILGPSTAWMRARMPLIAGTALTPLERVLLVADSGNGLSASLPFGAWLFINTDLSVHLHRQPRGEWVRLDARTTHEPDGVGLAESQLSDAFGPLGRSLQTLLLAPVTG